ncbi:MAG: DUF4845 domain-containing protein [Nevskiales bacterium]
MTSRHHQSGLTLISWIVVIGIVAFFAVVGVKSLPIYLNHFKILSIMKGVAIQPGVKEETPMEVRERFARRFDIDMVKHLDEREIKVVGQPGGARSVVAEYEVRVHMFYNVDAIYTFKENVQLTN